MEEQTEATRRSSAHTIGCWPGRPGISRIFFAEKPLRCESVLPAFIAGTVSVCSWEREAKYLARGGNRGGSFGTGGCAGGAAGVFAAGTSGYTCEQYATDTVTCTATATITAISVAPP